jgi:hypothetical protein
MQKCDVIPNKLVTLGSMHSEARVIKMMKTLQASKLLVSELPDIKHMKSISRATETYFSYIMIQKLISGIMHVINSINIYIRNFSSVYSFPSKLGG